MSSWESLVKGNTQTRTAVSSYIETEAIEDALFEIVEQPLYRGDSDSGEMIEVPHKAIVKADDGEVLYVGKSYRPIENYAIVDSFPLYREHGFEFKNVAVYNKRQFEFNLVNPEMTFKIRDLDINPRIVIKNSYDGSVAFSLVAGAFILVCSNGLTIGRQMINIKRKHTGSEELNIKMFDTDYIHKINMAVASLSMINWDIDQPINTLFDKIVKGIPEKNDGSPNPAITALYNRYQFEKKEYPDDMFALFMAGTYIGTHGHKQGIPYSYVKLIGERTCAAFLN